MENYSTTDLFLASTLMSLGYSLIEVNKRDPKRCKFIFEGHESLAEDITEYQADRLLVEPRRLLTSNKKLKDLIYQSV